MNAHQRQAYRTRRGAPGPAVRRPSGSVHSVVTSDLHDAHAERIYAGAGDRSSAESSLSDETAATSVQTLPALQSKGPDNSDLQQLEPVLEDDPRSWDLVAPAADEEGAPTGMYELERRAEQLFGAEHLHTIFADPKLLLRFTGYLNVHRPTSIPVLIYYLDALKALRSIRYANAIAEALAPLPGHAFTHESPGETINAKLEDKAELAFEILVRDDLPAYVAHTWVQVVSVSISRRILGTLAPHLREASEGLAEVFCLTDPSRADNPIVFASEEFARTTQYGMSYSIGRNCRFLQGPHTSRDSAQRLAEACRTGKEHTEVFVNYRRDGSPFLNLLMIAPLMDSRGNIRYFIGAQVDVSGLLKECSGMESLARLVERERVAATGGEEDDDEDDGGAADKDPFQELSEMFNGAELDTVRRSGGSMHKEYVDDSDRESVLGGGRPRLLLKDPSQDLLDKQRATHARMAEEGGGAPNPSLREKINGKLDGIYQHYLLLRPAPSLRILFTSPSLRVPGILQSPFLHRIGGSSRVRADLAAALAEGRGVTAKIRWLARAEPDGHGEGRPRWIHCTPLLGHSGAVGVWMVVLVDDESRGSGGSGAATPGASSRKFRTAPPVAAVIRGKDWGDSGRAYEPLQQRQQQGRGRHGAGALDDLAPADDHASARLAAESPATIVPARGGGARAGGPERLVSSRQETLLHEDALGVAQRSQRPGSAATREPSEFSFQLK